MDKNVLDDVIKKFNNINFKNCKVYKSDKQFNFGDNENLINDDIYPYENYSFNRNKYYIHCNLERINFQLDLRKKNLNKIIFLNRLNLFK